MSMFFTQIPFGRSCNLTPLGFLTINHHKNLSSAIREALEEQERKTNIPFVGPVQGLPTRYFPRLSDSPLLVCAFFDHYMCSESWHTAGVGEDSMLLRNSPVVLPKNCQLDLVYISIGDNYLELETEDEYAISLLEKKHEFSHEEIVHQCMTILKKKRQEIEENRLLYFFFKISLNSDIPKLDELCKVDCNEDTETFDEHFKQNNFER